MFTASLTFSFSSYLCPSRPNSDSPSSFWCDFFNVYEQYEQYISHFLFSVGGELM